jgi:hypothetical protein
MQLINKQPGRETRGSSTDWKTNLSPCFLLLAYLAVAVVVLVETFERVFQTSWPLTLKYISVCLLLPKPFFYISTAKRSKLGNPAVIHAVKLSSVPMLSSVMCSCHLVSSRTHFVYSTITSVSS